MAIETSIDEMTGVTRITGVWHTAASTGKGVKHEFTNFLPLLTQDEDGVVIFWIIAYNVALDRWLWDANTSFIVLAGGERFQSQEALIVNNDVGHADDMWGNTVFRQSEEYHLPMTLDYLETFAAAGSAKVRIAHIDYDVPEEFIAEASEILATFKANQS